ncbi:MAG: competence/damage-inducible protein A [Planctomycetota bacterium]|jgi:nicotinamide-nucleotide amidase
MRKASIVSVGNEILSGQTVDTNASYLGSKLFSIGIPVVSTYAIGDEVAGIARALHLAGSDSDIILVTGGLGPTDDDLTREGFAEFLGTELELQSELLERIESFFARRNRQMSVRNRRQACVPAGATVLANNVGTAPGFMVEAKGKLYFALPGVPSEMREMFEESVLGRVKELASTQVIITRKLRCFGTGESNISELLGPLMQRGRNPLINCTAGHGVITLHVIAAGGDRDRAQEMAEADERLLRGKLGSLVFGTGEQTLAEVVGRKLAQEGKKLAVAESCTGGILAGLVTEVPGASEYFTQGWVTYSNKAKCSDLGVPPELVEKLGAVSGEVAAAMAQGARKRAGADFAIGITGIAGPTGGSEQKPVGLVYISIASDKGGKTERFVLSGSRSLVRLRGAQTALNMLRLML